MELNEIENEKRGYGLPGNAIKQMLDKWDNEPIVSNVQIDEGAAELWKTKEQFEHDLWLDVQNTDLLIRKVKLECNNKVDRIRF
jgi:hypothetical protein